MKNKIVLVSMVNGEKYYNELNRVKNIHPRSSFVDLYTVDQYESMEKLILLDNGVAGIAVTKDGNLVSIFKDVDTDNLKNVIDSILPMGIIFGGFRLNCYGTFLTNKYCQNGFIPIARCKFDDKSAPKDWNYERHGKPNIYFSCLFTNNIDTLIGSKSEYEDQNVAVFEEFLPYVEYDEGNMFSGYIYKRLNSLNLNYSEVISLILNGFLLKEFEIYKNSGIKNEENKTNSTYSA